MTTSEFRSSWRRLIGRRLRRSVRRAELRLAHAMQTRGTPPVLARVLPGRLRRSPARHPRLDGRPPLDVDAAVARPVHLPERCRGSLVLRGGPPDDAAALERLVGRCQRRCAIEAPASWARDAAGAAALVALAASGAPVRVRGLPADRSPIGPTTLVALGTQETDRELQSVRLRRAALSEHGASARGPTPVSVLLASRRPDDVLHAVEQISRQRDVDLQLVVGLHGPGFADDVDDQIAARWNGDLRILRAPAEATLGEVLNSVTAAADRELVTKWDDDDWYGVDHLLDLVLAYGYSGAEVVGKFAEFVHLEEPNVTIRRNAPGAESYTTALAGGTLLTSRAWLRRVGGWPPVPRHVDLLLFDATRASGGRCYRTHGYQYLLRRRAGADEHTWSAPSGYFSADSVDRRPGLDLAFADIGLQ